MHTSECKQVLLPTAIIQVQNSRGAWISCRALLDSASQSNFVSKRLMERLNLEVFASKLEISGISSTNTNIDHYSNINISSRVSGYKKTLRCLILDKITSELPQTSVECSDWILPREETYLADPKFYEPAEIDMLIGAEIYLSTMKYGQRRLGPKLPVLQNTVFGWIVSGIVGTNNNTNLGNSALVATRNNCEATDELLSKFWTLEEVPKTHKRTLEEEECEKYFEETTKRDCNGRYVVHLPFKEEIEEPLGQSLQLAQRRFAYLERRLQQNPTLRTEYNQFLQEYLNLGHMELVPKHQLDDPNVPTFYIPHHAVIKESSTTTKLRVVFDASMKSSSGVSLNDRLKIGPTVQQDLLTIILRFRLYKYAFTADVEKMYRQIIVDDHHTNLQRILWRPTPDSQICTYRLKTVTYGTACAPYLATRCLQQLAFDDGDMYPLAKERVLQDFYVDDIMTGGNNLQETLEVQRQLILLMSKGGFNLRKWCSNTKQVLESIDPEMRETKLPLVIGEKAVKTLGLLWLPAEDRFKFSIGIESNLNDIQLTKRQILSDIAKIFDPLGLLGPVVVKAKIFLQTLWKEKIDWDTSLSSTIKTKWNQFREQLIDLSTLSIDRRMSTVEAEHTLYELHGFCDASQEAYGGCVYLRCSNQSEETSVQLVAAKSRVAPIKQSSIPRLELCGALILSRLMDKVINSLQLPTCSVHLWTDSTVALNWIAAESSRWKIFVAHRVSEIQELTANFNWHHVPTLDNPADYLSRGISSMELKQCSQWWHGPAWLALPEDKWPKMVNVTTEEEITELRTQRIQVNVSVVKYDLFDKYSTFSKLHRVTAYCIRFIKNSQQSSRVVGNLTPIELQEALFILIKRAQYEVFQEEINYLSANQMIKKGPLTSLAPFVDNRGIIRVGGRLEQSSLPYDRKHPIILPKHKFTYLLLQYEHVRLMHAGTQAVLGSIREKYWVMQGRRMIKKLIHECVTCYRFKSQQCAQLMGNLPPYRTQAMRPFTTTGVDYAGPILLKTSMRKNAPSIKAYIALFVCLSTRAIHLELVSGLSTNAFLSSFKRFISRRGKCVTIYSDNGTNFKGAKNEMNELYQLFQKQADRNIIIDQASYLGIDWKFIPPSAPHFGGIWEAGVKAVKHHLKRVLKNYKFTFEEYYTILTQVEACVNSRPLHPLSDDVNDFFVLTPGHFLIGGPLLAMPEPSLLDLPDNRLSRWQLMQKQVNFFWKRWSQDYLNNLQQRSKWVTNHPNIEEGTLVLLKEDNQPPLNWCLARVQAVHPGQDGLVRVVTVVTSTGVYKRPVTKICPLPNPEITTF